MRKIQITILFFLCLCMSVSAASAVDTLSNSTLSFDTVYTPIADGSVIVTDTASEAIVLKTGWKPNPMRAVWLGAVIPGMGQIYNRKYWKLPIVYGGFMGCAYAISWNSGMYSDYKNAYRDIIDSDETTNSFMNILPEGYTVESLGGISSYTSVLQTGMNTYRRYRDLSVIITVAFYAITLIDAYVDAQLYDFDITPDLSLQVQPNIYRNEYNNRRNVEMQLTLNF